MTSPIHDSPSRIFFSEEDSSPSLVAGTPRSSSRNSERSLEGRMSISSSGELLSHPQFLNLVFDVPKMGINWGPVHTQHFQGPSDEEPFIVPQFLNLRLGQSKAPVPALTQSVSTAPNPGDASDEESTLPSKFLNLKLGQSKAPVPALTQSVSAAPNPGDASDEESTLPSNFLSLKLEQSEAPEPEIIWGTAEVPLISEESSIRSALDAYLTSKGWEKKDYIGKGKFSRVYELKNNQTQEQCVLKVQLKSLDENIDKYTRFDPRRGEHLAMRFNHPNLIRPRVLLYWENDKLTETPLQQGSKLVAIIMPKVQGESLAQLLETRKPLGTEEIFCIIGQVASGLEVLHQAGIAHRDIQLGNVMYDGSNAVVIDYGIAKEFDRHRGASESPIGLNSFIAPERVSRQQITIESNKGDVWSLGVLTFHLFFGRAPLDETKGDPDLDHIRIDGSCDPRIAQALHGMLAHNPQDRWNMSQVLDYFTSKKL